MKKVLCIDAGHGMGNRRPGVYDPGAVGGGHTEADIVLAFARTIKWVFISRLHFPSVEVILTRNDDTTPCPVHARDNFASTRGATHFLSLHCNAGAVLANGTETFYRHNLGWATTVQDIALRTLKLRDRKVKNEAQSQHSRLAVMDFPGKVCLLELGFISNPKDRKVLTSRDARLAFAEELYRVWTTEKNI